ncbi:MAG: AAA family ATPase, partial [Mycoplasmataceae bacterium]|nr:AAA family ATPase [Mycoplasmataceae bacterium]
MATSIKDKIIAGCKKGQSFFITGPAGVGKTHLIKEIYEDLKAKGVGVALTSTTGINALNLGGITVHKFFGLQNRSDMGYLGYMKSSFLFRGISMRLANIDVVIIDEISMLRADTFELINELMKQALKSDKPFGGKSLIFTGDFFQIAPVVKTYEKKKEQWIFKSPSWINANIQTIVLDKIFRQKDPDFINFLQDIRVGNLTKKDETIIT